MGTHEGSVLFKFKGFKRKGVLSVFFGGVRVRDFNFKLYVLVVSMGLWARVFRILPLFFFFWGGG